MEIKELTDTQMAVVAQRKRELLRPIVELLEEDTPDNETLLNLMVAQEIIAERILSYSAFTME